MRKEFLELLSLLQRPTEETPSVSKLRALSGLSPDEQARLREAWPSLPDVLRRRVAHSLADAAEADITADFKAVFRALLGDPHWEVRRVALDGLWEDEDAALIPVLVRLLQSDQSAEVRASAATSLGRFALLSELDELAPDTAKTIHDTLLATFHSEEELEVRRRALEAVSWMGGADVVAAIEQAYQDDDERMTVSAVFAMGRSYDERWAAIVKKELKNPRPEIRYEAARAAGELELQDAVPTLLDMIDTRDVEIREAIIEALGKIGGQRALEALYELVQSSDEAIKWAALEALETARFDDDPLSPGLLPWLFEQGFAGDDWEDEIDEWLSDNEGA